MPGITYPPSNRPQPKKIFFKDGTFSFMNCHDAVELEKQIWDWSEDAKDYVPTPNNEEGKPYEAVNYSIEVADGYIQSVL